MQTINSHMVENLDFLLCRLRNHCKVLSRGTTCSDFPFEWFPLPSLCKIHVGGMWKQGSHR